MWSGTTENKGPNEVRGKKTLRLDCKGESAIREMNRDMGINHCDSHSNLA